MSTLHSVGDTWTSRRHGIQHLDEDRDADEDHSGVTDGRTLQLLTPLTRNALPILALRVNAARMVT